MTIYSGSKTNTLQPITRVGLGILLIVMCLLLTTQAKAHTLVRHCTSPVNPYIVGLISIALSYSDEQLIESRQAKDCSQLRQLDMLLQGELDLMWAGTTQELESKLIPIRVPVYKGLMGHRVFLASQQAVNRLKKVESLAQLKAFSLGQGDEWSDTKILKHAGFNVVTGTRYHNMFDMLALGRYELFPRAAHEVWKEAALWQERGIVVDKSIMLVYPMPAYIFVSPKNPELAKMLEYGLNQAINDGSFDAYFYADAEVKAALENTDFNSRKVFHLENPYLSDKTPLSDKRMWLDTMAFFSQAPTADTSTPTVLENPQP